MNNAKALRAAHILHKFCNRRKCDNCPFHDTESRAPCRLNTIPKYYQLRDIDEKMYGGKGEPTVKESTESLAYWEICSDGYYPYCSACKSEPPSGKMTKFCPECGRRMEG